MPHGYHGPSMAAPGYDLYYLNVMAGPGERAWRFTDDPATVAALAATHWGFARDTGVIVANPVAEEAALPASLIEPMIEQALSEAEAAGARGGDVTPFVLARLHELSDGRSLAANRRLVEDNAALAAEIAACYYAD